MLSAGLKGIQEGYDLPAPMEEDVYEFSPEKRREKNITELPGNLFEAIAELEKSELVREALGDHIFNKFIENKKIEWDRYRTHVSRYEIESYLPIL
jgi:glutamine synthetase